MRIWRTFSVFALFNLTAITASVAFGDEQPSGPTLNPPRPRVTHGEIQISGISPHLAVFNDENECGVGAIVPWAGRLWVVTYAPHAPAGSTDKFYAITEDLTMTIRPESIGGTPANRMIHPESQQLFIGPYVIDKKRNVRVIPYSQMFGRLTGNARHLFDPEGKIYFATMEEGFYEVDVETLEVTELWRDEQRDGARHASLPGYHGKGVYSGQGRLVYANNGEHGAVARRDLSAPSGVLATWNGRDAKWNVVRRNQFTEVTGPGGIRGNSHPKTDPIWALGWDHRSLILALLDAGEWSFFRLPKSSHSYDGALGWYTEWPRIREIGQDDLLMTMHGMFWSFPRTFRRGQTDGIKPRSSYLKVIGDFCNWNGRIVFGCDDAARSEFLNTSKAKGKVAGPAYSQSNLWFMEPQKLDHLGPARGRGAVWLDEPVRADVPSDPFHFCGFDDRGVHLIAHDAKGPTTVRFQVDQHGTDEWTPLVSLTIPASGYLWHSFPPEKKGAWIRAIVEEDRRMTVWFEYRDDDIHPMSVGPDAISPPIAHGLARAGDEKTLGGLVRAGTPRQGLQLLATKLTGTASETTGYYELKPNLELVRVQAPESRHFMAEKVDFPTDVLKLDGHSILYVNNQGRRYRLPIGNPVFLSQPDLLDTQRTSREVVTERDLFQAAGTFYELPAPNAGGFSKIMPIATHPCWIQDYCSWRGLLVLTGVKPTSASEVSKHIVRSQDGQAAVWLGAVDDLWQFGKPVGRGGPWFHSDVAPGNPSDPYLVAGYDEKKMRLSHSSEASVTFTAEIDISGAGLWQVYGKFKVPPGEEVQYTFPEEFEAYWIRFRVNQGTTATALLRYE